MRKISFCLGVVARCMCTRLKYQFLTEVGSFSFTPNLWYYSLCPGLAIYRWGVGWNWVELLWDSLCTFFWLLLTHTQICKGGSVLAKCCDYATCINNVDDVIKCFDTYIPLLVSLSQPRKGNVWKRSQIGMTMHTKYFPASFGFSCC